MQIVLPITKKIHKYLIEGISFVLYLVGLISGAITVLYQDFVLGKQPTTLSMLSGS